MSKPSSARGDVEARWVILAADGRTSTMGRHRQPEDQEVAEAARTLESQGIEAWLVRQHGDPWVKAPLYMEAVRKICVLDGPTRFEDATAKAEAARKERLKQLTSRTPPGPA